MKQPTSIKARTTGTVGERSCFDFAESEECHLLSLDAELKIHSLTQNDAALHR